LNRYLAGLTLLLLPFALGACGGGDDDGESGLPSALEREQVGTPRVIENIGSAQTRDRNVEFNGFDGLQVRGTYYQPDGATALIILLHSAGGTRAEWEPYASRFYEAGYEVLAIDLRGHGESDEYVIAGGSKFRANPLTIRADDAVTDIASILEQLPQRYEAQPLPVFVVGADAGANAAWLSTGVHEDVLAGVAVSAEDTRPDGPLSGASFPDAEPHDVLFVAGPGEVPDANALAETVSGDVEVLEAAEGTGVVLLDQPGVTEAVLAWIAEHLPAPS
jgi:pimeloyl-ACP methyl ester carboxylesterase